jgi:phosphoglycolate phosphatase-like HAD superfamily hydrolase
LYGHRGGKKVTEAILFDFDGVLCESVHIKTEAFYELYLPYGETVARQVREHHLANGGMSRYDKFRHYETHFLNRPPTSERIMHLAQKFSQLVLQKVIDAPLVKGTENFLERYGDRMRFFIVSATPQEEMETIAKAKGIDRYFTAVFGSPTSKKRWVEHILDTYDLDARKTLFVGDARNDLEAAKHRSVPFVLRVTQENSDLFPSTLPRIADLDELRRFLDE